MKNTTKSYIGLLAFNLALIIANGFLVNQNVNFKNQNRKLLLQNDSLQSVNILLQNATGTGINRTNSTFTNEKLKVGNSR